jgi:hypothetical protein
MGLRRAKPEVQNGSTQDYTLTQKESIDLLSGKTEMVQRPYRLFIMTALQCV